MKLPKLEDIEFSPLLWKENIMKGSELQTVKEFYSYFTEERDKLEWCKAIDVNISNRRILRLINGYTMFDILEWDRKIQLLKFKMWALFEDLVAEVMREILRDKEECSVVYVDRLPGFKGLDFVITNSKKKQGWIVGIQCKRYIGSALPKCKLEKLGPYSRGTSSAQLYKKGMELQARYPRKKFVLAAFNAFRTNKSQAKRFQKLKNAWDCVLVFDKSIETTTPYTYKIALPEIEKIVKWC